MNIACWSGPRNLSTAMMYAFGARRDCGVWDEPFYAAYLAETGLVHPLGAEIIAAGQREPNMVRQRCASPSPDGRPHFYQKHMTHHMVWGFEEDWFDAVVHVFLIRHPAHVLASYERKREKPRLADIGFVQQGAIYRAVLARGLSGIVIDSRDIRAAPETMLSALCGAIGLPFDPAMLSWPAGGHPSDGVWARHWYGEVHASTGFAGPEGPIPPLSDDLQAVCDAALPHYLHLRSQALTPTDASR